VEDRFLRIVLKNPGIGRSSKSGFVVALAMYCVARALGEAATIAYRRLLPQAAPPAKNSQDGSAASTIVIEPKIGVFQHNLRIAAVHRGVIAQVESPHSGRTRGEAESEIFAL
jgi:hypothetical protein